VRPSRRALLATAPLALLAAACGEGGTATEEPAAAGTGPAAFPVTVEHALGSTTVPAAPQRVVCLGWGSQDVVWALGQQPVGIPEITYGASDDGTLPWWEGHFDATATTFLPDPGSGDLPFEQIAALAPDLVLAVYSGITDTDYATLSRIAPTVGYPDRPWLTSWQDQTRMVGQALGRSAEAERLVADAEADLADRAAATPSLRGKTFSYVYATEANLSVYLPGDSRVDALHALGLVDAPGVTALAAAQDAFYTEVAKERARDVDGDLVVGYGTLTRDQLRADPVYATVPAVAADAVAWIDDEQLVTATSATLLSLPWALDRLVPLLDAAARAADAS
jgi:iron complex transport system substrate-binding protein